MSATVSFHRATSVKVKQMTGGDARWLEITLTSREGGRAEFNVFLDKSANFGFSGELLGTDEEHTYIDTLIAENKRLTELLDDGQAYVDEVVSGCAPEDWGSLLDTLDKWRTKANEELHKQGKQQ